MFSLIQPKKAIEEAKAPQSVIHIKHSITLRQYKVWLVILQKYREFYESGNHCDDDGLFSFSKSELDNVLGYEIKKDVLKSEFEKIRREPIILNYLEKDKTPVTHGMGFISEWKVSSKTIKFKLPSFLENVMKGLDQPRAMFQLLNWQIFNHFSGKYEAIIYKLCRDYVGVKNTPYMTIEEFRGYVGLKEGEHEEYKNLNRRVIEMPVNRINESELSDIFIETIYKKSGRKVLGLYFVVSKKNQTTIPFPELEQNEAFRFAKVHIEASMQMEYLALRKPEEIELCIERANEYGDGEATKGKEPNYGAIYRKAITEGWHTAYADKKAQKEVIEKVQQQAKKVEEQQKTDESLRDEKVKGEQIAREKARMQFEALPEPEKEKVRIAFESQLNEITVKSWGRAKQKNPTSPEQEKEVKMMFFIFYKNKYNRG
jgi:hypothetical protein